MHPHLYRLLRYPSFTLLRDGDGGGGGGGSGAGNGDGGGQGGGSGSGNGNGGGSQGRGRHQPPASRFDDDDPDQRINLDYVRELRAENKKWRLLLAEERNTRDQSESRIRAEYDERFKKERDGDKSALTTRETEIRRAADRRVMTAELRVLAREAGMVDLDALALLDTSKLKLDDKGELVGGKEAMDAFKQAKPHLFAAPQGSSSTGKPPKPGDRKPFDAMTAKPEERDAELAKHGVRRTWRR